LAFSQSSFNYTLASAQLFSRPVTQSVRALIVEFKSQYLSIDLRILSK
jgi:hypothetical protein